MMKSNYSVLIIGLIILMENSFARYEDRIPPELVEDQRKYSSKAIYNMIKHAKINHTTCNVKMRNDSINFVVEESGKIYSFINIVKTGKRRPHSNYDCILSKAKSKLTCKRRLPGKSRRQKGATYITLIINLDEKGYATSMHGNETTRYEIFGKRFPMFDSVNSRFSCDIQIPAKLKDPAIVNNGRDAGGLNKSGSDEENLDKSENSGSATTTQK